MKTRLRVKEIAEQQGFNISTLSRKADVSLTTVRRVWRNPYWKATNEILQRLATTLGVSTGELIEDVPDDTGG